MPVHVQRDERLTTIAKATLEVAADKGAGGVTIRAVADRLGGSTTIVTNYLPSRLALINNVVDHVIAGWRDSEDAALRGVDPADRLEAFAVWSCSTEDNDELVRRLFLEMWSMTSTPGEFGELARQDALDHHDRLEDLAGDAYVADAAFAADVLHLAIRGFYLAGLEDPERWTSESTIPVMRRLVHLLRATQS